MALRPEWLGGERERWGGAETVSRVPQNIQACGENGSVTVCGSLSRAGQETSGGVLWGQKDENGRHRNREQKRIQERAAS